MSLHDCTSCGAEDISYPCTTCGHTPESFWFTLPPDLVAKLKAQASEQTRSMSQQVEHIVGRWFADKRGTTGGGDACICDPTYEFNPNCQAHP